MNSRFDIVTVIGVGLLGGSLGLALKSRGLVKTIRGVGHRQVSLDKALEVGAIDEVYTDAALASDGADLVVVCTPAALVPAMMDQILPVCGESTVVTDVASTKADICSHAEATWPRPLRFIGSHPMAGSEKFGPEHAKDSLYIGSKTLVARGGHLDPVARAAVCDLWRSVGSTVIDIDPPVHDALVARTSHIPHILAACIAQMAAHASDSEGNPLVEALSAFAGPGFRDMTRVAAGRPEIWRDICLTNRDAILAGFRDLTACLEDVSRMVSDGSGEELADFFRSGQDARNRVLEG